MDIRHEANCLANELFYRNSPTPAALALTDAEIVRDKLAEAIELGRNEGIERIAAMLDEYAAAPGAYADMLTSLATAARMFRHPKQDYPLVRRERGGNLVRN